MADTPRPYWKGQLRLSLVSIGVTLYAATQSASRLQLHQIHKPSGKRIRYEKVAPGVGPVESEDIVKGFQLDNDAYVVLEPGELEEIKLESRHAIDLVQFVDYCEVDPRYFDRPYYLAPQSDESLEGFAVVRDALHQAKKMGLGQMAMRGREYLVAIKPCGRGLLLETLRYAEEVRASDTVFEDIEDPEFDEELTDLALELIERKSAPFDAEAFKDRYGDALRELIERKRGAKAVVEVEEGEERRQGAQVIDLMEALKRSVKGGGTSASRAGRKQTTKSRKRSTGGRAKKTTRKAS
jgi:DNA end-binding protein Ku